MFTPAWCSDTAVPLQSEAAREHPTSLLALTLSADDDPAALGSFPALQAVRTRGVTLNKSWIDALEEFPHLMELRLDKATVSASTLAALARLKGLRSLSVTFNSDTPDEALT